MLAGNINFRTPATVLRRRDIVLFHCALETAGGIGAVFGREA